jgi:epoxide hydrolase-like predicted phosphatase
MGIKAVIWDLGGVLVRTEDPAPRRNLADRYGLESKDLEKLVFDSDIGQNAQLGNVSSAELWEHVLARLGAPPAEARAIELEFWGGDRLDMGLLGWIRHQRPRYKTALLSNAWDSLRLAMGERWGILDAFDAIVISAEVGMMKPDPRIYRLVLEQSGVEAAEAVFIDDLPANVDAARALGMHAIRFHRPAQALADLAEILDST